MFIMIGILSIDFDYFIDVSARERDLYFPDGSDEIPDDALKSMWEERYLRYPELKNVGVIDDYYFLKEYLRELDIPEKNFIMAESHKSIKNTLIDKIPVSFRLRIVNIDFHHDYYHYFKGNDYCNCGNWLRRVIEERPDTKYYGLEGRIPNFIVWKESFPLSILMILSPFLMKNLIMYLSAEVGVESLHLINKFEELASMRLYMYNCSRIRKMI